MAITWARSTAEGQWLGASGAPWWPVVQLGPPGFEAYARVRYIPDPVRPGMAEADVELPEDHPRDLDQGRAALAVLAAFTTTPLDCWFAVWEGCSSSLELPAGLPLLELPHRRYGLLRGALTDLASWEETVHSQLDAPPAFVWPADRRWCFASDVDPTWAGVGAEEAAVRALLAEPGLDVVRADPGAPQPVYR
jgi:hypothetical protein